MKKRFIATCMAMCMVATTVAPISGVNFGISSVYASEATPGDAGITVKVGVHDYTAVDAGIKDASKDGKILETEVEVPKGTSTKDVIEKAFEDNDIQYSMTESGYVSEINNLSSEDAGGYSGWLLSYNNDDYANGGVSAITLSDGDTLSFDYTVNVDMATDDVGTGWYGNPYFKEISVGGKTHEMTSEYIYPNAVYKIDGEVTEDKGTADDPFELTYILPEDTDITTVETDYVTSLNSHYAIVDGLEKMNDFTGGIDFSVSSLGGTHKSYYHVNVVLSDVDSEASNVYEDVLAGAEKLVSSRCEETNPLFQNEWEIIDLARYGYTNIPMYETYYASVEEKVKETGAIINKNKVTENERTILALTALGVDCTDVAGYNILEPLYDETFVTKQGVNGVVFGLLAIDAANAPDSLEEDGTNIREFLVQKILTAELSTGGWTFFGAADPDMTGMAIQALAPYYNTNTDVKEAVDRGLDVLSNMQRDDGGFASWGSLNSESAAQVVTALSALGIDADTDPRFVKNGISVLDNLISFKDEATGGFRHIKKDQNGNVYGENAMATQQGTYALVAYYRYKHGMPALYDMSDADWKLGMKAPAKVEVANASNGVKISYSAVDGAERYKIYRKAEGETSWKLFGTTTALSAVDKTVVSGVKYTYTVRGIKGSEQGKYDQTGVSVLYLAQPVVKAENKISGINVTWNKINGAESYYVYRKANGAKSWTRVATVKADKLNYADTKVSDGVNYVYTVRAVSGSTLSTYTSGLSFNRVSRANIAKVENVVAGTAKVTVSVVKAFSGYQLQYATKSNFSDAKTLGVSNGTTQTVVRNVSGLKKGTTYYVRIRGYKKSGNTISYGAWSTAKTIKISR